MNKKTKKILVGPEILTRGFIYVKDSTEIVNKIKELCSKVITDNTYPNYIDYTKIKNTIREELSNYLFDVTGNKPMIITVMQEI